MNMEKVKLDLLESFSAKADNGEDEILSFEECRPWHYLLSDDDANNKSVREEFFYDDVSDKELVSLQFILNFVISLF